MKRETKILSLVVAAIALVAVLCYSVSTLMTNGTKLQGAVLGPNRVASTEGTTIYKDWTELTEIDNEYSYSTLIYTKDTRFYAHAAEDHQIRPTAGDYYRLEDMSTLPVVSLYQPTETGQLIITNCGYDKDGTPLSAVIDISVNNTYRSEQYYQNLEIGDNGIPTNAPLALITANRVYVQNVTDDGKMVFTNDAPEGELKSNTGYVIGYNMPLGFQLNAEATAVDLKLTYYKKLTLKNKGVVHGVPTAEIDTANSEVATDITKVNAAFNDFDTDARSFGNYQGIIDGAASDDALLFEGKEGIKPTRGNTTLYYNKTGKQTLTPDDYVCSTINQSDKNTFNFRMTEKANGIFINRDYSQNTYVTGSWQFIRDTLEQQQGYTREQSKAYYCRYAASCVDGDPTNSKSYFKSKGFSYLNSTQFLTDGLNGEFSILYEMPGGGINFVFMSPQAYSTDAPKKTVSKETLKIGEIAYYNITQTIPNNYMTNSIDFYKLYPNIYSEDNYIAEFTIEDKIDPRLVIVQDSITMLSSDGIDLKEYFDITVVDNKLTVTSNANAEAFFATPESYNTTFTLSVPIMYVGAVDKFVEIPNKASVTIKTGDNGTPVTKETNEVIITIGEHANNLTYDCTTNGGKAIFEPTVVEQIPGTSVDLTKVCVKDGNKFVGWVENPTDTTALTTLTMPQSDKTIYGIFVPSTCDNVLYSSVYTIDQSNHTINIPNDATDAVILSNVTSKGTVAINGEEISVICDGVTQKYKISRFWINKTGNDVIRWTIIISGTLLLAVIALLLKVKNGKKEK